MKCFIISNGPGRLSPGQLTCERAEFAANEWLVVATSYIAGMPTTFHKVLEEILGRCRIGAEVFVAGVSGRPRGAVVGPAGERLLAEVADTLV